MRITAEATCLSWIPPETVEGTTKLPFGLGIAHYDSPPPDSSPDLDALLAADAIRFANQLRAWIEVEEGHITTHGTAGGGRLGSTTLRLGSRGVTFAGVAQPDINEPPEVQPSQVRFTRTAGGHTGVSVPRAVPHPPFWRLAAPLAWSTIALTVRADGSSEAEITDASPFPRTIFTTRPVSSPTSQRSSATKTGFGDLSSNKARGEAFTSPCPSQGSRRRPSARSPTLFWHRETSANTTSSRNRC